MLRLVSPSSTLLVSLEMAKSHLRVEHDEDDALIEVFIAAAEEQLAYLGRALTPSIWAVDVGPCRVVRLPMPPLIEVLGIEIDADGAASQLDASEFDVTIASDGTGSVRFASSYPFDWDDGVATVLFRAGYTSPPKSLRAAVLLIVGDLYKNREMSSEKQQYLLPRGVDALVTPLRIWDWNVPDVWRRFQAPTIEPEPEPDADTILREDGFEMLREDGFAFLREDDPELSELLREDGFMILREDNSAILREDA